MAHSLTEGYLNFPVCQLSIGHMKAQKKTCQANGCPRYVHNAVGKDNEALSFTRFSFSGEESIKGLTPAKTSKNERSEKKLKKRNAKSESFAFLGKIRVTPHTAHLYPLH